MIVSRGIEGGRGRGERGSPWFRVRENDDLLFEVREITGRGKPWKRDVHQCKLWYCMHKPRYVS